MNWKKVRIRRELHGRRASLPLNMRRVARMCFWLVLGLFWPAMAQVVETKGQLSGWLVSSDSAAFSRSLVGLRYIPTFAWEKDLGQERAFDVELAADGFLAGTWERPAADDHGELYRAWLRYSSRRFELRAGLQKLDFGPAVVLRSLRWFDRVDPRDPLKLTDGVQGLLGRYYFPNNANIWVWGLYDNGRKGLELLPTFANRAEFGGRLQHPWGKGEFGLTTHFRKPDLAALDPAAETPASETRLGFDGKWDLGAGFWFEAVLVRQEHERLPLGYRRFLTLGADQTLPLGNGLRVLAEHLRVTVADAAFGSGQRQEITAISADYHTGLLNSYLAICTYDWENRDVSFSLRWGRVYDRWSFYVNGFRNPERTDGDFPAGNDSGNELLGAGKGIQLLFVYNH